MENIYDVKINMLSVINTEGTDGDADRSESTYDGRLEVLDGRLRLTYSERTEGGEMSTEIHVLEGRVVVKRRGAIVSDMVFSEGKRSTSVYSIPPHSFDMTVDCRRLKIKLGDREGRVDMLYKMEIGGEARSARMRIIWN
jgi:uncharacterized beta-barrel protein YwiB (DUF1934 family)